MIRTLSTILITLLLFATSAFAQQTVPLTKLDLTQMRQGWGKPQVDKSITQKPLSIAGQVFKEGVGTHANSVFYIDLDGGSDRFQAKAGVDDGGKGKPVEIQFRILGDGNLLWKALCKADQPAVNVDVDVRGVKKLLLLATSTTQTVEFAHADWAEARLIVNGSAPKAGQRPQEPAIILTPPESPQPRINGPKAYGARPGRWFLFTIPATGQRPMEFAADGLPEGLKLDKQTGIITGAATQRGTYVVKLSARNALGVSQRDLRIVIGDTLALTPSPMGWNSWYCFFDAVTDQQMRQAADAMVSTGMINHGYSYINIDDGWENKPNSKDPRLQGPPRDANGMINSNAKFPDMKALTDYIHSKGLKAGIYSSPGPLTCAGYVATYQHEPADAQRFAQWGFDLLKHDWCSYGQIAKDKSLATYQKPYQVMQAALAKVDRDILYSLCQYGMGNVWEWGAAVDGHCWRTTGDLGVAKNLWNNVEAIGFSQNGLEKWAGPGHWNDPDFILIGYIGWGGKLRPTPLSPNEQYSHVTLWSILAAPLVFSGDMTKMDPFTLSLLTNDEVLEVNLDPLGKQGYRAAKEGDLEVWVKPLETGRKAVALFNRSEFDTTVTARWTDLGLTGKQTVRDLWRQKDLGEMDGQFSALVPSHGVIMIRVEAAK